MRAPSWKSLLVMVLAIGLAVLASGCSGKAERAPVGVMDNPGHHFMNGLALLDQGSFGKAGEQFDHALAVDAEYPPALAGKGAVLVASGDSEGYDLIDEARSSAEKWPADVRMWPEIMQVRALSADAAARRISVQEFLDRAVPVHETAVAIAPERPEPYFYMGEALVSVLEFGPAEGMYRKVLELERGYENRASERWKLVQDVNRAAPGTTAGKRIALVESLTRADMAALLTEELGVEKFYGRTEQDAPAGYAPPEYHVAASDPVDIDSHPLAEDIRKVLRYGVRGMELFPGGTFRPQVAVTRAEAAMMFEDVIVRATGRAELATKYIGTGYGLPDVSADHPAYNAIMLCMARGVMTADLRSGRFRPLDTVSGVEALLAIRRLKRDLSLF